MKNLDIKDICSLARKAGAAILQFYKGDIAVEIKDDATPLTAADEAAHRIIVAGLQELTPDMPVLSEEGRAVPYAERKNWSRFWLVDPLDGTKEFIRGNGEFTVNIALIEGGRPVLGVVYVPVQDALYYGADGEGAWRQAGQGPPEAIRVRRPDPVKGLTVVMSRSHPAPELQDYLRTFKVAEAIAVGSSLKLCAVAEGRADFHPRLGPTMEWDTAAGQAVVINAGGCVERLAAGGPLQYNKEDLRNPQFVVSGIDLNRLKDYKDA